MLSLPLINHRLAADSNAGMPNVAELGLVEPHQRDHCRGRVREPDMIRIATSGLKGAATTRAGGAWMTGCLSLWRARCGRRWRPRGPASWSNSNTVARRWPAEEGRRLAAAWQRRSQRPRRDDRLMTSGQRSNARSHAAQAASTLVPGGKRPASSRSTRPCAKPQSARAWTWSPPTAASKGAAAACSTPGESRSRSNASCLWNREPFIGGASSQCQHQDNDGAHGRPLG